MQDAPCRKQDTGFREQGAGSRVQGAGIVLSTHGHALPNQVLIRNIPPKTLPQAKLREKMP